MKKGISPLIAAVILIAFVVALAGIASAFFTDFLRQRESEISEQGSEIVHCSVAYFKVDPETVYYNSSSGTVKATLYVQGNSPLKTFNMTVYKGKETEQTSGAHSENGFIPGRSVTLSGDVDLSPPFTKIVATNQGCSGLSDTVVNQTGNSEWV